MVGFRFPAAFAFVLPFADGVGPHHKEHHARFIPDHKRASHSSAVDRIPRAVSFVQEDSDEEPVCDGTWKNNGAAAFCQGALGSVSKWNLKVQPDASLSCAKSCGAGSRPGEAGYKFTITDNTHRNNGCEWNPTARNDEIQGEFQGAVGLAISIKNGSGGIANEEIRSAWDFPSRGIHCILQ